MDQNTSYAPPTAGTILKFISRRAWRSKWLIGAAALAAAVLAFALHHPVEIWTGRMRITIGEAPPLSFIFQSSGPSLAPLEPSRALVARLSDKYFREKIGNSVSFAPETAAVSKTAVISSLRGIVLEDEKEIMVEVSAGSPGDVQAALEAVATQIGNIHRELMDRSLRPLRARIEDARVRIAIMEKSNDELNRMLLSANADGKSQLARPDFAPTLTSALPAWNTLRDRVQVDENLAISSRPTKSEQAREVSPTALRSVGALSASLLAGLLMLITATLLFAALSSPRIR